VLCPFTHINSNVSDSADEDDGGPSFANANIKFHDPHISGRNSRTTEREQEAKTHAMQTIRNCDDRTQSLKSIS